MLTLCMLGNFSCFGLFGLTSADFFKIIVYDYFIQEYLQIVKQFGPRSGPTQWPDLGPNCLQRLSAESDGTSR